MKWKELIRVTKLWGICNSDTKHEVEGINHTVIIQQSSISAF